MKDKTKARRLTGIHPSLLDIAFVLVFMFLLLSTLASTTQQEAEERSLPPLKLAEMKNQMNADDINQIKSATVSVKTGPVYYLDEEELALDQLGIVLASRRPPEVEIRGDVTVPYGAIAEVLRICRENGITSVALTYKSSAR